MHGLKITFMHMRQDQVLFVADAQFVMAIVFGNLGHHAHLLCAGIPRSLARCFQADRDNGVGVVTMGVGIGVDPIAKNAVQTIALLKSLYRAGLEGRWGKSSPDLL